jgi:NAD-dependent deacetylase
MIIPDGMIEIIAKARSVAALTGAGVSAESGIKTFRDKDGLWTKFNPAELASPKGFLSNPALVWEWYKMRKEIIFNAKPNPGHYALAEMETILSGFSLITQNIDRLHQKAGSKNVIELHGNLEENHCNDCELPFNGETSLPDGKVPLCPECSGMIRPSVVWFGEMLPEGAIISAQNAARDCGVFLSAGTSGEVYPAASLPVIAIRNKACFIEINPNRTALTNYADFYLQGPTGEIIPQIVESLKNYFKNKEEI